MSWPAESSDSVSPNGSPQPNRPELLAAANRQLETLRPSLDLSLPIFARIPWALSSDHVFHRAAQSIAAARATLSRDLTDKEATALVDVARIHYAALGEAKWYGVSIAAFLYWRGRATFRFPFYTPKVPPLGGGPLTQLLRMCAYTAVVQVGMTPVTQALAVSASMSALKRNDGALKGMMDEIREAQTGKGSAGAMPPRPFGGVQQRPASNDGNGTDAQTWESGTMARDEGAGAQQHQQPVYTARWPQDPSTQYTPDPNQQRYQTPKSAAPEPEPSDRWSSSPILDDASPIAPEEPSTTQKPAGSWAALRQQARNDAHARQQQQQQQQQQSSGSSWNQVRQQSGATSAASASASQGQQGESYTFSSADVERETAKSQAQKEFDAMLERERRGDGPSGGGAGWRR